MTELDFLHGVVASSGEAERLPRGQHDLSSEFVSKHQRSRILEACAAVLYEHGYTEATVAQIVRRARVSRRTFYENFENKEHCCVVTFGHVVECIADSVRRSYQGDDWAARLGASFADLGRLFVEHPEPSYAAFVEVGSAGREAAGRRSDSLALCRSALWFSLCDDGPASATTSPIALEVAVLGLHSLVAERMREEDPAAAAAILPDAVAATLEPLVGAAAAAKVADHVRVGVPRTAEARENTA